MRIDGSSLERKAISPTTFLRELFARERRLIGLRMGQNIKSGR